jgi:hypothetical protein
MTVDHSTTRMRWSIFFPPGTRVLALPNWRRPRLYVSTQHAFQRWEHSSFYPASRFPARLYRLSLRFRAATGIAQARTVRSSSWPLGEFVQDALPQITTAVARVGTSGPAQETTVQLWDENARVLGYLKYAEKDAARKRLQREHFMLSRVPDGLGPKAIKIGPLDEGEALLKSAIPGDTIPPTLPPPEDLIDLLNSLTVSPPVHLEDHPWVHHARRHGTPELNTVIEPLASKRWSVVVQHGDFAPWNMLRGPDGNLRAVDWEYGTLEGFPFLDLIHYILHTSGLIYRWAPLRAARYAVEYLVRQHAPALTSVEAWALTRLAAYDAYSKALEDGQSADVGTQPWRRAIWESTE